MKKQIILMNRPRMVRALHRMALQIWERLDDEQLLVIGLNERGFATASILCDSISELTETKIAPVRYDVHAKAGKRNIPDCNDKFVLLVDDVIFSGKTMFEALSDVSGLYKPERIELAVLIDRGHRKYPLYTDLKGLEVPTKSGEHIELMLKKGDLHQAILFKNKK